MKTFTVFRFCQRKETWDNDPVFERVEIRYRNKILKTFEGQDWRGTDILMKRAYNWAADHDFTNAKAGKEKDAFV